MTLRKPTAEQLLADFRRRIDQGYIPETIERMQRIASRSSDLALAHEIEELTAYALTRKRPNHRPPKAIPRAINGVVDLDAMPSLTVRENEAAVRSMIREMGICEQIHDAHVKHGRSIAAECAAKRISTKTYYKWYPARRNTYGKSLVSD